MTYLENEVILSHTQAWEGAAEGQRMTVMDVEVTGKKMKGKKDEGGTRVVMVAVIR